MDWGGGGDAYFIHVIDREKETLGFQQAQKKKKKKRQIISSKALIFAAAKSPFPVHRGPVGIEATWLLGWGWGG